jgi:hypothetical protein
MPVKFSSVKIAGLVPTLEEITPWLGAQKALFSTPESQQSLKFFLDACDIKYGSTEQDKFVLDGHDDTGTHRRNRCLFD